MQRGWFIDGPSVCGRGRGADAQGLRAPLPSWSTAVHDDSRREERGAGQGPGLDDLDPYVRNVADEALRRGIRVEVTDAASGEVRLSLGGRSLLPRECLSELTTAAAMSRCDEKRITRRILQGAGVRMARGAEVPDIEGNERPGLANYEPRPTAQRFVDLLFPESRRR